MAPKPYTCYLDERRGRWTEVAVEADRITISPSRPKSHWVATLLAGTILAVLAAGMFQTPLGIFLLVCMVLLFGWQFTSRPPRPTITIDSLPIEQSSPDAYHAHQIGRFSIRENKSRNKSEDSHLLQIYMELRGEEKLILLYQDYFSEQRNEHTREVFNKMDDWLKNVKR